jgi:hypothetical protein
MRARRRRAQTPAQRGRFPGHWIRRALPLASSCASEASCAWFFPLANKIDGGTEGWVKRHRVAYDPRYLRGRLRGTGVPCRELWPAPEKRARFPSGRSTGSGLTRRRGGGGTAQGHAGDVRYVTLHALAEFVCLALLSRVRCGSPKTLCNGSVVWLLAYAAKIMGKPQPRSGPERAPVALADVIRQALRYTHQFFVRYLPLIFFPAQLVFIGVAV